MFSVFAVYIASEKEKERKRVLRSVVDMQCIVLVSSCVSAALLQSAEERERERARAIGRAREGDSVCICVTPVYETQPGATLRAHMH